jgi:NADPH:quinone reductase-like Zn-dependent oxidoreductase
MQSLIKQIGELELSLASEPVRKPDADDVVVRIDATPINPSDVGLLLGAADLSAATQSGISGQPAVTAPISPPAMRALAARVGVALSVGNEGAGQVIDAGSAPGARALLGRTVAISGGGMYAQYRRIKASDCLILPEGATAEDGASAHINPLTALGMVETMRREGHTALVHTAAASNLGQMLNRMCIRDGIGLVNIVRNRKQAELLKSVGATYICDSTLPSFFSDLTEALIATGATLAFDAIGGGKIVGQILTCMEAAASRKSTEYNMYGTSIRKQIYIYGALDLGPTELRRSFGMSWNVGGWLLFNFLREIDEATRKRLLARVAAEIKTTFASHYTKVISLQEALDLSNIRAYARNATGEKFLIAPHKI